MNKQMKSFVTFALLMLSIFSKSAGAQSQFTQQTISTGGSNVLLVGDYASDGGNDLVTINSSGSIVCIPNNGGAFSGQVVSSFSPVQAQPVKSFANGFGSTQPGFLLMGSANLESEYQRTSTPCQFTNATGFLDPLNFASTPNAILVAPGINNSDAVDVLISLNGSESGVWTVGSHGALSGQKAHGGPVISSSVGAILVSQTSFNLLYKSAYQLSAGGQLSFNNTNGTSSQTFSGVAVNGTILGTVVVSGADMIVSASGTTLYVTPLTWTVSGNVPVLGGVQTFSFSGNVQGFTSGAFGGGQSDDIAVADSLGNVTILVDSGATNWIKAQTISVAPGVLGGLQSITSAVLDPQGSGQSAGLADIIVQRGDGNATILWQQPASTIYATPSSLSFPTVAVGFASSQNIIVFNVGSATLSSITPTLSGSNAADFGVAGSCIGASVAPGQTCLLTVTYAPSAFPAENATLSVASNASNGPLTISLTAAPASQPKVSLSATSVDFSTVKLNENATRSLTVTNIGAAGLTLTATLSGSGFTSLSTNCSSLGSGTSCTVTMTFAPTTLGAVNGSLTITSNALSSPDVVSLTGTGVPETEALSVAIAGTGSGSVAGNGINCPSTCSATPTAGTAISLIATPASGSLFSGWTPGNISSTTNAFTMPNSSVSLTATFAKIINMISTPTTNLSFGPTNLNVQSAAQVVTLSNGSSNVAINNFNISIGSGFLQTNTCVTLAAGSSASCTISITFDPTTAGQQNYSTALVISSSANTITIPIAATAQQSPSISVQPVSQTVTTPATATFSVTAACIPACTYSWMVKGAHVGLNQSTYTTGATTIADNGSSVFVLVSNSLGTVQSSTAILTVNAAPVFTTGLQAALSATAGNSTTFSVVVTGQPTPTISWTQAGAAVATGPSYTFTPTLGMNGNVIVATASNSLGQVSTQGTLTVSCTSPVVIMEVLSNQTFVPQGSPVTLTAGVQSGTGPFTWQWLVGGVIVSNGSVYTITTGTDSIGHPSSTITFVPTQAPNGNVSTTVQATSSNACGASSTAPQQIIVTAVPATLVAITFANINPSSGIDVGTVAIATQATGDVVVSLSSDKPGSVAVPATVTIPRGQVTANFNATVTTQSASELATISATYNTSKISVGLNVQPSPTTPGFTLSTNPSSATIVAGQSATAQIAFTPQNGFTGTPTYTCSDPAPKSTCSISGNTLTITTTAATSSAGFGGSGPLGIIVAIVLMLIIPKRKKLVSVFALVVLVTSLGVSCGAGGSSVTQTPPPIVLGTPAGTYTITVVGSSGTAVGQNALFTLTVQ